MRIGMAFAAAVALLLLAAGCEPGAGDGASVSSALSGDHKVLVCHPRGQADKLPLLLEIDRHALPAHLAHGDWPAGVDELCEDLVDNDCDGLTDEDCDPCPGGKCCPEGENCQEPPA